MDQKNVAVTIEQPAIEVPFLKTKNSLICTLLRNGHPLGKRLDDESRKGDVELDIFAPYESACLVRRHPSEINQPARISNRLDVQLHGASLAQEFSVSQRLAIANIFAQKEKINAQLDTLMLCSLHIGGSWITYASVNSVPPTLTAPEDAQNHIKILDCTNYKNRSGMPNLCSRMEQFGISYDDETFSFILTPISARPFFREHETGEFISWNGPTCTPDELETFNLHKELEHTGKMYFHASVAKGGEFEKKCFPSDAGAQKFRIQYGEYDLFEHCLIDEALLLLEVVSNFKLGEAPRHYWTLALARNKKYENDLQRIFHNRICWLRNRR